MAPSLLDHPTVLTVNSVHDDTVIQCRIFRPPNIHGAASSDFITGAVLAHPYAPLGGSQDDHTIVAICQTMLNLGITVATFNFRGAKPSGGRTSWSGEPELDDYRSVLYFFVLYLLQVRKHVEGDVTPPPQEQLLNLILAGYSYGSMIASRIHGPQAISDIFPGHRSSLATYGDRARALETRAETLAIEYAKSEGKVVSSTPFNTSASDPNRSKEIIRPNHLLISPLLPPISGILTPFSGRSLFRTRTKEYEDLTKHRTLAIWGSEDIFTSSARLRSWGTNTAAVSDAHPLFEWDEVHSASHFWQATPHQDALQDRVRRWCLAGMTSMS